MATTDDDGAYSVTNLPEEEYTVTPSRLETIFTPPSRTVDVNQTVGNASGVDFTAQARVYSIAGTITDAGGAPLAGVTVTTLGKQTTTAAGGTYKFTGLLAGSYTVTPSLAEYSFTPANRVVAVNQTAGSATGIDFQGAVRTYSVGGRVTSGGTGLAGVAMTLTGGATTTTAADGTYQFAGLTAGTYTVTPALDEYLFTPTSRDATVNDTAGNATGVSFTATVRTYSLSGRVVTGTGQPLSAVLIQVGTQSVSTDGAGRYTVGGLRAGDYTVTPSLSEYDFTPETRSVELDEDTGNATGVDFVAEPETYSISGRTTGPAGGGIGGVQVTAGGRTATSAANGDFTIDGLVAGRYMVTPFKAELTFAPTASTVAVNETAGDATGLLFIGVRSTYTITGAVSTEGRVPIAGVPHHRGQRDEQRHRDHGRGWRLHLHRSGRRDLPADPVTDRVQLQPGLPDQGRELRHRQPQWRRTSPARRTPTRCPARSRPRATYLFRECRSRPVGATAPPEPTGPTSSPACPSAHGQ